MSTFTDQRHIGGGEIIQAVPDANLDRALAIERAGGMAATNDLTLVLNWRSELKPR